MSEDERAIRAVIDTWLAASKAGDTATLLNQMTDDVVFLTPGREPFGRQEFAAMSAAMSSVSVDGKADIQELQVLGDWAFLRNRLEVTVTPRDGVAVHQSGYTLTLLRKDADGRWRLARDANLLTKTA